MCGGPHKPDAPARGPSLARRACVGRRRFSPFSATVCRSAVLTRRGVIFPSSLALAERQTTMKKLLALTALGLFAAASVNASAAPFGGLVAPPRLKPDAPVLSGIARLRPAVYDSLHGWKTSYLPRWQVQLGGNTYYLVFQGKGNLE